MVAVAVSCVPPGLAAAAVPLWTAKNTTGAMRPLPSAGLEVWPAQFAVDVL